MTTQRVEFKQGYWNDNISESFIDRVRPVLQKYAQLLGRNIYVSNAMGEVTRPTTAETSLSIRFYSTPVEGTETSYGTAFGYPLNDYQRYGFKPTGRGVPIIDDSGQTCAELVGNTLYVLLNLAKTRDNVAQIMDALMQRFMLSQSPKEYKQFMAEQAQKKKEANRHVYVQVCRRRIDSAKRTAEDEIRNAEANIRSSMQKIVENTRHADDYRRRLTELNKAVVQEDSRYALEYDKLLEVPGVISVEAREGVISVFTDMIEIKHDSKTYEIGKFQIDIQTNGSKGGVLCYNLTGKKDGYAHPHIQGDGSCCLGNITEGVAQLIAVYEYSALAQLMINFLRSYYLEGRYADIENWPVKQRKSAKKK